MDRIETPIKKSKTTECKGCGAAWRIYEDDVEVECNQECKHYPQFWITCEECNRRMDVSFVLSFVMKHALELKDVREKRGETG